MSARVDSTRADSVDTSGHPSASGLLHPGNLKKGLSRPIAAASKENTKIDHKKQQKQNKGRKEEKEKERKRGRYA